MAQSGPGFGVKREGVDVTVVFQRNHSCMACKAGERPKLMGADQCECEIIGAKAVSSKENCQDWITFQTKPLSTCHVGVRPTDAKSLKMTIKK